MQSEGRDATLSDVIEFFKAKNTIQEDFISQVCKLTRFLLDSVLHHVCIAVMKKVENS